MDWGRTIAVAIGILLVGGAATFLLGFVRVRKARAEGAATAGEEGGAQWLAALLLSVFLGQLGIDRFYLGYVGLGILKMLSVGGLGVWWLVDIILIATNRLKDAQGKQLVRK